MKWVKLPCISKVRETSDDDGASTRGEETSEQDSDKCPEPEERNKGIDFHVREDIPRSFEDEAHGRKLAARLRAKATAKAKAAAAVTAARL